MSASPLARTLAAAFAAALSASALAAVDANTASAEALEAVSGIGPSIARRIVDERRKGPYRSLDDLQTRVKGIGEAKARRLAAAGLTVGSGSAASA
ncbi:MAG: helix-hairpin-helix domain-containing protein, partial [Burkholderiales bacterium]